VTRRALLRMLGLGTKSSLQSKGSEKKSHWGARWKGKRRLFHEIEGAGSGAVAGAVVGMAAGPPGAVAGAILGAVAGGITGAALDGEASRASADTRELDGEIGVGGGDLGAPNLEHPPALVGAYSGASAGVDSSSGEDPAEGPIQIPGK
jgi:hypothetical protein